MKRRLGLLGGAAALLLTLSDTSSQAQMTSGYVRSTHGSWSLVCDTPPGASGEQCALIQDAVAQNRPEINLSVAVSKTADRKAEILRVLVPLDVLLPAGLGLIVDGKDIGKAQFVHCIQTGCYSELIIDDKLNATLRNGSVATFMIFQTPEEGIPILIDLKGFGEGFDALP